MRNFSYRFQAPEAFRQNLQKFSFKNQIENMCDIMSLSIAPQFVNLEKLHDIRLSKATHMINIMEKIDI